MNKLSYYKRMAKIYKKNHVGLTLMQAQHEYALSLGFKSWSDLREHSIIDVR